MSNGKPNHPPVEQLSAFGLGQLDAATAAAVERHVADCTVCGRTLCELPDDQLVHLLRQAFHDPTAAEATTLLPSAAPLGPAEFIEHPRYRIVEILGQGGMGTVYKAEHRLMERHVALKVIDRGLTGNPAVVERFRREVRAAAQLNHPNIVHAYDADQAGDRHFLVMEFVEGQTLARLVEEQGPLPVSQACDAIRQAALGLQRAADCGMVHRDIKPQNLMRTPEGVVKILDFGLARLVSEATPTLGEGAITTSPSGSSLTQLGMVMGTADYMAPEQASDPHAADVRADIYSLGCTLYYLLTGQPPFARGTVLDKLLAHREQSPRPLSEFRRDVPLGVARIVERMMAKDPARRFQSPAGVAEALKPFASPSRPALHPWMVAALVALLLAGSLFGSLLFFQFVKKNAFFALPNQPATIVKTFSVEDKPITQDGVTVEQGGWRIEASEDRTVRLYEIRNAEVEACTVLYEAQLKTANVKGKAYLEMWCRFPDGNEYYSSGKENPLSGTTDWASYQRPFFVKKGERVDLIKLNVVIEGGGTVWIKDISLRVAPLP
jgi:serine/threonine protein kinase